MGVPRSTLPTNNKNGKALVFGAAVIDVCFHLLESSMPGPNTSTQANSIAVAPGGKGLTQAIGLSRMGFDVSLVAVIGDAIFNSNLIIDLLEKESVRTDFIDIISEKMTPITGIITFESRKTSCAIGNKREEDLKITVEKIDKVFEASDIESYEFVLITHELPIATVNYILNKLNNNKFKNTTVIVTPAPPSNGLTDMQNLNRIDYLVAEVWELQKILNRPDLDDIQTLAETLQLNDIRKICIKTNEHIFIKSQQDGKNNIEKNLRPTLNAHDNAAERDALCVALAYVLKENDRKEIMKSDMEFITMAMALSACQMNGAYTAMPTVQKIKEKLKNLQI